jgi:signal transduction histidine kinase
MDNRLNTIWNRLKEAAQTARLPRRLPRPQGLSGKLLLLTVLFVLLAEVLIFVPSVSNFRRNWLQERLNAAQIAALTVEAVPGREIPKMLREELLRSARVHAVSFKRGQQRFLVLQSEMSGMIDEHFDLQNDHWTKLIADALRVFGHVEERTIRVMGKPTLFDDIMLDVVIDEQPLRAAMMQFARNIAILSLLISAITAALVYISLNALLVRPMRRLTSNMVNFTHNPEDDRQIIVPTGRTDEIGTAERELAHMQEQLSGALRQKSHLAALGLAVSKINHDLRNILANAQLISDHLGTIDDPTVQRLTPRLIHSLDRAIRLCSDTLHYGQAKEERLKFSRFPLLPLLSEIAENHGLPVDGEIDWRCYLDAEQHLNADRDQIYRVLGNLVRNARQALDEQQLKQPPKEVPDCISISAREEGDSIVIKVSDTGPGIPETARESLFNAFQGSTKKSGSGLGLAIAAEIIHAHGGTISLAEQQNPGAVFVINLPK